MAFNTPRVSRIAVGEPPPPGGGGTGRYKNVPTPKVTRTSSGYNGTGEPKVTPRPPSGGTNYAGNRLFDTPDPKVTRRPSQYPYQGPVPEPKITPRNNSRTGSPSPFKKTLSSVTVKNRDARQEALRRRLKKSTVTPRKA